MPRGLPRFVFYFVNIWDDIQAQGQHEDDTTTTLEDSALTGERPNDGDVARPVAQVVDRIGQAYLGNLQLCGLALQPLQASAGVDITLRKCSTPLVKLQELERIPVNKATLVTSAVSKTLLHYAKETIFKRPEA